MFSVIIPLYNKAETVERAIRSVLAQTEQNFELIVVDDGSKDNGAELVQKFSDPRIRLIQQPNGGVSAARNTGIAAATNEYITFLDADDEYLPDCLQTYKRLIENYPTVGCWAVGYRYMDVDGNVSYPCFPGLPTDFEGILEHYFHIAAHSSPPMWTGAVCLRKEVLQKIDMFPVGVTSGEDLLTWSRAVLLAGVCLTRHCGSTYYIEYQCDYRVKPPPKDAATIKDAVGSALIAEYEHWHYSCPKKEFAEYLSMWFKMRAACDLRRYERKPAFFTALRSLRYSLRNWKAVVILFLCVLPPRTAKKMIERFRRN